MELTPFLTVKSARAVVEFYKKAFGATELSRQSTPAAVADRAVAAGAKVVFPVADQPYGMRQGRIADPEGHHWLIGRNLR